jgi:glyoxylase-like metal-dependent hydrolase (beta-lactamase superfamily II)
MLESFRVGDATITRIPELALAKVTPSMLLADADPGELAQTLVRLPAGIVSPDGQYIAINIHSWLVRDKGRTILIDTGAGNGKDRPGSRMFDRLNTDYLDRLKDAGATPEDIDYVLLTHLHVDHVGWNTRLVDGRWTPMFPKARYVFVGAEHAYFTDPQNLSDANRTSFIVQRDSVDPIIEAGLADMIEANGNDVIEGFAFHSTPGHTANHASISFRSAGETALFSGDVMHHLLQVHQPNWNSVYDAAADDARASRLWALRYGAETGAPLFTAHFPQSAAGRVAKTAEGFSWTFL